MGNENKTGLYVLGALIVVSMFLSWFFAIGYGNQLSEKDIGTMIDNKLAGIDTSYKGPSNAEITQIVKEEVAGIELPTPGELDNDKINDLWEEQNKEVIDEIEEAADDAAEEELEYKDYKELKKYLELSIEGFDEIGDVDYEDTEITVTNLGLEDDEDKTATVVYELEVEYTLKEGPVQDYKVIVIVTADVVFDEGDLDDSEVELVYA